MSLIKAAGAGDQSTGFYKHLLDQSLKFDQNKSSALSRTPASAGNQRLWTFSAWAKKSTLDLDGYLLGIGSSSTPEFIKISNSSTDQFEYAYWNGSVYVYQVRATALLRDTSAWYHIVLAVDTAQGTAANRVKFYVNGTQLTDFSISTYPTQNADTRTNAAVEHRIGSVDGGGYYDGYIAEVNFIDGAALTPSSFGETKDGIWIPKDTSGLTFGTNGYHLTFKDDVVSEGFNAVTYRGNNGTGTDGQSISGVGFKPAFIWIKNRVNTTNNVVFDYVRGNQLWLEPNSTNADQDSGTYGVQSHDADGWTMGGGNDINRDGEGHVAWCWEGGGTPTATNSAGAGATPTAGSVKIDGSNLGSALAGTIPATKISANTARGFSIVGYEATGTAGTIAHGLSAAPEFIIVKHRDQAGTGWPVYFGDNTDVMYLGENYATADDANAWNDTSPTSTVFSVGPNGGDTNNSLGGSTIAYCFHSVSGYSKFGTWQNNNSTTGTQVTGLGFKPAFIIVKNTDNTERWFIQDNTRQPTNLAPPSGTFLVPNATSTEGQNGADTASIDFQDDGFQIKTTNPASGEISFGTRNYIYMAFADTREAAFFKDVSSNGNHFTPVNLDYRDSVPDTPSNNFAVGNPLSSTSNNTFAEGNLKVTGNGVNYYNYLSSMAMPTGGKYYFEVYSNRRDSSYWAVGICKPDVFTHGMSVYNTAGSMALQQGASVYYLNSTVGSTTNRYNSTAYIFSFAIDLDNNLFHFRADGGTWENSGDPAAGSGGYAIASAMQGVTLIPWFGPNGANIQILNFGQDSSFNGNHATANSNADGNGHGSFAYAPPSGFLALCSQNLPDPDIIDGTEHFNTVTYSGNGTSGRDLEGFGFQPGFVWLKERGAVNNHILVNGGRGADKGIHSDSESTLEFTGVTSAFTSDGITLTDHGTVNNSSDTYVAWAWKGTESFSNDTSATSVGNVDSSGLVNTTAGFSFTTWTADGSVKNIAHGMGKVPTTIWTKPNEDNWFYVYHQGTASDAETDYLALSRSNALADYTIWNDTAPTTAIWTVGAFSGNNGSEEHISFLFADVEGFSKHGFYIGNANADGPFVYTGFRPAWIMIKNIVDTEYWMISDNTRSAYNPANNFITPHVNSAEYSLGGGGLDIVSNGFKIRSTSGNINGSGDRHIYMAFADQPFKFSNAR